MRKVFARSALVVEADPVVTGKIGLWLAAAGMHMVAARNAKEAIHLLHDAIFIGCTFDRLIVDYHLREATGCRVLYDFQHEYPSAPVALMTSHDDISINVWARTRGVQLLRKPLCADVVMEWARRRHAAA